MEHQHHHHNQKESLFRILTTIALLVILYFLPLTGFLRLIGYLAVYLFIGFDVLQKAWKGILGKKMFNEKFLMSIATVGVFVLAIATGSGDYFEAVAVMLFYQIGELFEHWAVDKSRHHITQLMDIRPDSAWIEKEGKRIKVHPESVEKGETIIVLPGEKVPLDGIITDGISSLNTMALTGESMPRDVQKGDRVFSGSVNMQGVLHIQTENTFQESTVSGILKMMEDAPSKKARAESLIHRFAKVYTPIVCCLALAIFLMPPLLSLMINGTYPILTWLYRALTFLVISCPCALVISIPLSFFAGIGGAGKKGILIKGANHLENLSRVHTVFMDKTGTITKGCFTVSEILPENMTAESLLEIAAYAESASSHPIAMSLKKAYGKEILHQRVEDIQEKAGFGVYATVDGKKVLCGNAKLLQEAHIAFAPVNRTGVILYLAVENAYAGAIIIADEVKETAKAAVDAMKKNGVQEIIMLTGDSRENALHVQKQTNVDRIFASLLPVDKVNETKKCMANRSEKEKVLFVGDGINDAPVLMQADIGIAMGGMGIDAALEAADVVLMEDDLNQIVTAMQISKKTMRIVKQNIIFSLGIKVLCLIFSAMGLLPMGIAIFADVGVMVLAVLNALRSLHP